MLLDVIRLMYAYDRWANGKVYEAAAQLTPKQLHTPGPAGHGSVHGTLLHLLGVQRSWFSWFDGSVTAEEGMRRSIDPAEYPDFEALNALREVVEAQVRAYLDRMTEAELATAEPVTTPMGTFTIPKWKYMLHVANHGTQHRSEAAAMLTEHGHSPGALDLVYFLLSTPRQEGGAPV